MTSSPAEAAAIGPAADLLRHRQFEMASQWDAIENDLRDPKFWGFLSATDPATRIELLLDMLVIPQPDAGRFGTFYAIKAEVDRGPQSRDAFWDRVLALHARLRGWRADLHLYHLVGFLVGNGTPLRDLVREAESIERSAFRASLDGRAKAVLGLSRQGLLEATYQEPTRTRRALELFNLLCAEACGQHHPFDHGRKWTLEHIHAQHAERLNRKDQWEEWLREHRAALADLALPLERRDLLLAEIDFVLAAPTRESFDRVARRVAEAFTLGGEERVHEIANLALLDGGDNSAVGNAVFEVKRRHLLTKELKGEFIPVATRHVFSKAYTPAGAQQLHYWGPADRDAYRDRLVTVLGPYLAEPA